jgi:hypothetical protein
MEAHGRREIQFALAPLGILCSGVHTSRMVCANWETRMRHRHGKLECVIDMGCRGGRGAADTGCGRGRGIDMSARRDASGAGA